MSDNFNKAVEKVLLHEGGFVNHINDTGGATNWGITQKVYETYIGRKVSIEEMKNMPRGNAVDIYKKNYWDKVKGDSLTSFKIGFTLFDQGVNRGPSSAIKQAQTVLGIYPDGIIGSETIKRINNFDEENFLEQYLKLSEDFYRAIVKRDPTQMVFLKGWLHRVDSIRDYVSTFSSIQKFSLLAAVVASSGAFLIYSIMNNKKLASRRRING